jgi:hypothetical protein
MRLSVSAARDDVLVAKKAPVVAKRAIKPVIFIFIVLLLSVVIVIVFVSNVRVTIGEARILRHGV